MTPNKTPVRRWFCVVASVACLAPNVAFAHAANPGGGFYAGFTHPVLGVDHMLAMVAVGLWGAVLGRPLVFALPMIFPAVMAVGGVLGMLNAPLPSVEVGIAVSVLLLGLAVATAFSAPVWLACALIGVFAIFHGYAHGAELPDAADPISYSTGFVAATGLLHILGIGIGLGAQRPAGAIALRGAGGLIASTGAYFLWSALH